MKCQYIYKNGNQCKRYAIGDLDRCHIRSHQTDMFKFQNTVNSLGREFHQKTIDLDNFFVFAIESDGACAYRCMVRALNDIGDSPISFESDYLDELLKLDSSTDETEMANLMQQIVREWIMSHQDHEVGDISLRDYTCICHDLDDINEYNELYKRFSGEENHIYINSGRVNKNGRPIMKKHYIKNRWGGSPELYAFTQIFNVELTVYVLKRFSDKICRMVGGSLKSESSRLLLVRTFNQDKGKPIRFLLTNKDEGHYCYMKLK